MAQRIEDRLFRREMEKRKRIRECPRFMSNPGLVLRSSSSTLPFFQFTSQRRMSRAIFLY